MEPPARVPADTWCHHHAQAGPGIIAGHRSSCRCRPRTRTVRLKRPAGVHLLTPWQSWACCDLTAPRSVSLAVFKPPRLQKGRADRPRPSASGERQPSISRAGGGRAGERWAIMSPSITGCHGEASALKRGVNILLAAASVRSVLVIAHTSRARALYHQQGKPWGVSFPTPQPCTGGDHRQLQPPLHREGTHVPSSRSGGPVTPQQGTGRPGRTV